jgi:hypothetical protein
MKQQKYKQSVQQAQEALELYQRLEKSGEKFRKAEKYFQDLLEDTTEDQKVRVFALHHLAFLDYYVFEKPDKAFQYAQEALESYQRQKEPKLLEQMEELIETIKNSS